MTNFTRKDFKRIPATPENLIKLINELKNKEKKTRKELCCYYMAFIELYLTNYNLDEICEEYLPDIIFQWIKYIFYKDMSRLEIQPTVWDETSMKNHGDIKSSGTFATLNIGPAIKFDLCLHGDYLAVPPTSTDAEYLKEHRRIHKISQLSSQLYTPYAKSVPTDWCGHSLYMTKPGNAFEERIISYTPLFFTFEQSVKFQDKLAQLIKQDKDIYCYYYLSGGEKI